MHEGPDTPRFEADERVLACGLGSCWVAKHLVQVRCQAVAWDCCPAHACCQAEGTRELAHGDDVYLSPTGQMGAHGVHLERCWGHHAYRAGVHLGHCHAPQRGGTNTGASGLGAGATVWREVPPTLFSRGGACPVLWGFCRKSPCGRARWLKESECVCLRLLETDGLPTCGARHAWCQCRSRSTFCRGGVGTGAHLGNKRETSLKAASVGAEGTTLATLIAGAASTTPRNAATASCCGCLSNVEVTTRPAQRCVASCSVCGYAFPTRGGMGWEKACSQSTAQI